MSAVECPRCQGSCADPDEYDDNSTHECCGGGRYGCDTEGCTGSIPVGYIAQTRCILCNAEGVVEAEDAFAYALGIEPN